MADLYFAGKSPVESGQKLVSLVLSGDYTGAETVDAAIETVGRVHALRGPTVYGAPAPAEPTEESIAALANEAQEMQASEGFGASEDDTVEMNPALIAVFLQLATQVFMFFLNRR